MVKRAGRALYVSVVTLLLALPAGLVAARADERVVTTLADYEDDSVAVSIAEIKNALAADCDARPAAIPARGQRSLMIDIGTTTPNAAVTCNLRFRLDTPFEQADRVSTHAWINEGFVEVRFRVRDAKGRVFQTVPMPLRTRNRWVRLVAGLAPSELEPVGAGVARELRPAWPLQIRGYHIRTTGIGRQTVYLDDLQVEHRVSGAAILRGEFQLDKPTHMYEPGALVRAAVVLENTSRSRALPLTVQIAWLRSDGSDLTTARQSINLPASGDDYRSRQAVDFSQRINNPGLYQLVARMQGPGWTSPAVLETTIAITRSNRALPRGRADFFGVWTNLMREPPADQSLEIDVAREVGVQLVALETPWRTIEPSQGTFDFEALDRLVDHITRRDMAIMIVLSEPPQWLAADNTDRWERQGTLLEALVRRYGERIGTYQPLSTATDKAGRVTTEDLAAVDRLRRRVTQTRAGIEVIAPAIAVPPKSRRDAALPTPPAGVDVPLAFETTGASPDALASLQDFATQNGLEWQRSHRWFHRAELLAGSGALCDAIAVLRHYVQAAAEGAGGVVWFDLRDDTSDPRHPQLMRGLVRRDFSPKTPLLGFASTVGMLHGLFYAGQVTGTPPQFDSALFIGGSHQVAVLFPKPNRVLPAVLAPFQLVPGSLAIVDVERRLQPLVRSVAPPLTATIADPVFITLDCERAQAEPKLGLAQPWLRVPRTVLCDQKTTLPIEIDLPVNLRRSSYLQIILPSDAPVESSLSSRMLRGDSGDTLTFDSTLTRRGDAPFPPTTLTIRVALEGQSVRIPVTLRPLFDARPVSTGANITDMQFLTGRLAPAGSDDDEQRLAQARALHVGYDQRRLHVAFALPPSASPSSILQVGVALEGADGHAETRIENLTERPTLTPAHGTSRARLRGWRCTKADDADNGTCFCSIVISTRSLGITRFEPGTRILLAARYIEPSPSNSSPSLTLEWGSGLDGARCTAGYHWIRLADPPEAP